MRPDAPRPLHRWPLIGADAPGIPLRFPHVVWTEKDDGSSVRINVRRYATDWNPLGTPVSIITRGAWRPDIDTVLAEVRRRASQVRGPPVLVE